jgi:uncharacterized protein YcgI (DUF1989 family)
MEPLGYVEHHMIGIHLAYTRVPRGLTIETVYPLAPGESVGCSVTTGTTVHVLNPKGHQVVDLWAFVESDPTEYLSLAHNRTAHYSTRFQAGHVLVSNRFKNLLRFIEDTTDGFHDSFHAACSAQSYERFGSDQQHPNCEDNLQKALHGAGIAVQITPPPWNLFEKSFVDEDGLIHDGTTSAKAGDYVELYAECDLFMVFSACRSTIGNIQGGNPAGAQILLNPYDNAADGY